MSARWLRFGGLWKASGESPEHKMYLKCVVFTLWNEISWPFGNFGPSGRLQESCQVPTLAIGSLFPLDFWKQKSWPFGSIWPCRNPQGSSRQNISMSFTISKNLARDIADCLRLPMAGPKRLGGHVTPIVFAKNPNLAMIAKYCHQRDENKHDSRPTLRNH